MLSRIPRNQGRWPIVTRNAVIQRTMFITTTWGMSLSQSKHTILKKAPPFLTNTQNSTSGKIWGLEETQGFLDLTDD